MVYTRRLTTPNITYEKLTDSQTGTLSAAGSENYDPTIPAGELWRIMMLYMNVSKPAAGSSGTHTFRVTQSTDTDITALSGAANFNVDLQFKRNEWASVTTEYPSNIEVAVANLYNIIWNDDYPFRITYLNQTDVDQTNTRTIKAYVEKRKVA